MRKKIYALLGIIGWLACCCFCVYRIALTKPDYEDIKITPTPATNIEIPKETVEVVNEIKEEFGEAETVTLTDVVDGDTIKVIDANGNLIKVRLIGIDTPESVHVDESKNTEYGNIASDYTKMILSDFIGKNVYLTYDEEKTDKYGRTLAYVYLAKPSINSMLNYMIIANGYAKAMTIKPNTMFSELFTEAEQVAKDNQLGLWAWTYDW